MSYSQSLREIRDTQYSYQIKDAWDNFNVDIMILNLIHIHF